MTLTQIQKDLIFGSLLGDGNMQTFTKGRTWRYRALQKTKHKDYLFHKYEILKPFCGAKPVLDKTLDERTNREYERYYFNTLVHPSLNFFGNMFYTFDEKTQKWIKNVPKKVNTFLTPRALAYFYMDDGALKWLGHSNAMRICTENFTQEDVKRIQNALKTLYNIETNLNKKTLQGGAIGYRIFIPERSSSDFRELINPYLVECMKYKVSDRNYGHL